MKIVVIGAGYAGTLAANRLARKLPTAEITVINPRAEFVERIRLHQRVADTAAVTTPLSSMLHQQVTTRVGSVDKVGEGTVVLNDEDVLEFDYAVLAVGSSVEPMPRTIPVGTPDGAERARAALANLPTGGAVTVIGAGPTGIETAAEVAEARPDLGVRLVGSAVGESFSHRARRRIRLALDRLGVTIVEDVVVEVATNFDERNLVRLRSGGEHPSDLALWAIVSGVPDLARQSGLEVDSEGKLVVDAFLRSVSDNRVFAAGDCAAVPCSCFACASAEPQGIHVANTLARLLTGRRLKPYSQAYFAVGVGLGRTDAVAQFTRRDDSPRRAHIAGRGASLIKEGALRGAKYNASTGGAGIVWLPPGPK